MRRRRAPRWTAALATVALLAVVPASASLRSPASEPVVAAGREVAGPASWTASSVVTAAARDASFGGSVATGDADPGEIPIVPPSTDFDAPPQALAPAPTTLRA